MNQRDPRKAELLAVAVHARKQLISAARGGNTPAWRAAKDKSREAMRAYATAAGLAFAVAIEDIEKAIAAS